MGLLQKEYERLVEELYNADAMKVELVRIVDRQRSLNLSEDHIQTLAKALGGKANEDDSVTVQLDGPADDIVITSDDMDAAFKQLEVGMESNIDRAIQSALENLPSGILVSLYEDAPKALRHRRQQETRFRKRLFERWKEGLDRLEMLIIIAQESGNTYISEANAQIADNADASPEELTMMNVLIALQTRACRVASEVLLLLKGGDLLLKT